MLPIFISEETALGQSGVTYRTGLLLGPAGIGPPGQWGFGLPTLTKCASGWTTLQFDNKNCGSCGVVCDPFHTCCEGECVLSVENCGGCGTQYQCPPFHICCSTDGVFSCTLTSNDPTNCGICNNVCDFFPSPVYDEIVQCCSQGACLSTDDLKTNPQHCGNCETDCSVTCGSNCNCSGGHCCPPCTVWFDGASGPNWGLFGAIAGGIIEGALGALTLGFIGNLIRKDLKPGCYSCSEINKGGAHLACCDLQTCTNLETDNENCGRCGENCGIWSCEQREFGQVCTTSNRTCQNGRCGCLPGLPDLCDGQCVNLATGTQFCGTCGNVCNPDTSCCLNGDCLRIFFDSDPNHCGSCQHSCAEGQICCNGQCKDSASDPANCGACGNICAPGQTCCDGLCTDLQTDVQNCGICGRDCLAKFWGFVDGGGHTCCDGSCIDVSQDVENCGACGMTCGKGEICSSGICSPPIQ